MSRTPRSRKKLTACDRLCRRPAAKTSLDRVTCHGGERDPVRYAQLGEHVPEVGVHGMRDMYAAWPRHRSSVPRPPAATPPVRSGQALPPGRCLGSRRRVQPVWEGRFEEEWLFCWPWWGRYIFEKTRPPVGTAGFEPATP